jgi:hypothetical protein
MGVTKAMPSSLNGGELGVAYSDSDGINVSLDDVSPGSEVVLPFLERCLEDSVDVGRGYQFHDQIPELGELLDFLVGDFGPFDFVGPVGVGVVMDGSFEWVPPGPVCFLTSS